MINYSEFLVVAIDWNKEMSRNRLEQAFKSIDADHNGKISIKELMVAFGGSEMISEISKKMANKADANRDREIDGDKMINEIFKKMIKEADINRDGEIDFKEFCIYMENFKK
ncbi:hypothetical protein SteCoe_33795 [Stentor coeruleus]|uniref:EF-hand domain-containing protein n=1 Tax=Stentor coeruleus TaxID=5963 RepID=A0A1R2AW02_9CILI|nr:hypothetical protein SteCoe_33795 [Stentor coeruleus]